MHAGHAVPGVRGPVCKCFRLFDVCDRVHTESARTLFDPEIGDVVKRLPDLRIFPVEIRLFLEEGVVVVLLTFLAPGPCGAAENASPVCGLAPVSFGVPPDIPVAFVIFPARF